MGLKQELKSVDLESKFLSGLIELSYGQDVEDKLKKIAKNVSWANGWPTGKEAFWNAEAFMWGHKIEQKKRNLISNQLSFLQSKNLDLGCGSYSYLSSVGFDLSEKMLAFNENCFKKVQGDLEQKLPFKNQEFDSVTAIFVLNYINNYPLLLSEVQRILNLNGTFVMVLYDKEINPWQRQKEVNSFPRIAWKSILEAKGFTVKITEKENLLFFNCKPIFS